MNIYLALDIGEKRTGIAKSDSMGIIIKPLKTILSENLLAEIKSLDQKFKIEKLIIGEAINIKSGNQDTIKMIQEKIHSIKKTFPEFKIELIDESYTSKEAETILKQKGLKLNKDNKELIDQYAAAIILETYWTITNNKDYLD